MVIYVRIVERHTSPQDETTEKETIQQVYSEIEHF